MKLILVLGTSLSAAAVAAGFAMITNQALSRESDLAETPARPILPARVAPDLSVDTTQLLSVEAAQLARAEAIHLASAPPMESGLSSLPTTGNTVLPIAPPTPEAPDTPLIQERRAVPVPLAASALPVPPPRQVEQLAYVAPPPPADMVATELGPIPARNFEYLPLIGVYR